MTAPSVALVIPPGLPGTTPNHEGAVGLGACEQRPGGFRYAPHTAAVCAAALRQAGWAVHLLDAPALGLSASAAAARLAHLRPDVVAVQVAWATRAGDAALLEALRCVPLGGAPVVAWGVGAPWMGGALAAADHVLLGEPELALPALCAALRGAAALRDPGAHLPRIVTPGALGAAGYDAAGRLTDLDALPDPAWDLAPLAQYSHLSVVAGRG
ncbi:MAG: hypothetical protein V1772_01190, partial [Chloroflexota bacterium]